MKTSIKTPRTPFNLTERGKAYAADKENRLGLNALVRAFKEEANIEGYCTKKLFESNEGRAVKIEYKHLCNKGRLLKLMQRCDDELNNEHKLLVTKSGERKTAFKSLIYVFDRINKLA